MKVGLKIAWIHLEGYTAVSIQFCLVGVSSSLNYRRCMALLGSLLWSGRAQPHRKGGVNTSWLWYLMLQVKNCKTGKRKSLKVIPALSH